MGKCLGRRSHGFSCHFKMTLLPPPRFNNYLLLIYLNITYFLLLITYFLFLIVRTLSHLQLPLARAWADLELKYAWHSKWWGGGGGRASTAIGPISSFCWSRLLQSKSRWMAWKVMIFEKPHKKGNLLGGPLTLRWYGLDCQSLELGGQLQEHSASHQGSLPGRDSLKRSSGIQIQL